MTEKWKDVPGYSGLYEVSDRGRVWSVRRNDFLRAHIAKSTGYLTVSLCVQGKPVKTYVHALVLRTFVGPAPQGYVTRHFPDGTKTNNNLTNLSWGTRADNQADRIVHGTDHRGESHVFAKLNDDQVRRIRSASVWKYGTCAALAREFGVNPTTVSDVRSGRSWAHVKHEGSHGL